MGAIALYIPIWLYSNGGGCSVYTYQYSLYIPIWLYSNVKMGCWGKEPKLFTFQSGYIQMVKLPFACCVAIYLYITIWLYSNIKDIVSLIAWILFTFQSGYIQIGLGFQTGKVSKTLYIPIWLYSNPDNYFIQVLHYLTLHSNLVIFKSFLLPFIHPSLRTLHSNLVIFK